MDFEPLQETPIATDSEKKVGRWPYFFTKASQKSKVTAIVALGLGVLCVLSLILSANTFVNGSVFKIPALKVVFALSGDERLAEEFEELEEEAEVLAEELDAIMGDEDLIRAYEEKHHISFEEMEREQGITLKEYRKIMKTPSLAAMSKGLSKVMGSGSAQTIQLLIYLVVGYTAILVLLAALAVLLQKTSMCVLSCVLSLGFICLTGGVLWGVLFAVGSIGAAVSFGIMKKEYRLYKKGC